MAAGEERAGHCDGAHLLHIAQWAARDGDGSTGGVGGDGESHRSSSPLRVMGGTVGHGRSGNGEVGSGRGRKGARWERERCEPGATKRLPRRSRGWATPMRGGEPASSGAAATCHEAERWRLLLAKKGVRERRKKRKKKGGITAMWVPHVELVCQTKSKRRISETTLQNYLGSQIALVLIVGESRYLILRSIDMNHIEAIVVGVKVNLFIFARCGRDLCHARLQSGWIVFFFCFIRLCLLRMVGKFFLPTTENEVAY